MVRIIFQNKNGLSDSLIPSESFLKKLQSFLENMIGNDYTMSLVLCDNSFIHTLNNNYRHIDRPTDVLSFSQIEGEDFHTENHELGDVILSLEQARLQADNFGVSFEEETARLSIHGSLHLLGYDHERGEKESNEMFKKQDELLDRFMKTI